MTSSTRKLIIPIRVLSNISRSKSNQTMKFYQLIVYIMGTNFLKKKSSGKTKWWGKISSRLFSKKWKLSMSLDQQSETLYSFLFLWYVQIKEYQNRLKLWCWAFAFTSNKVFKKSKNSTGASLPDSFSTWVLKKNISHIISY